MSNLSCEAHTNHSLGSLSSYFLSVSSSSYQIKSQTVKKKWMHSFGRYSCTTLKCHRQQHAHSMCMHKCINSVSSEKLHQMYLPWPGSADTQKCILHSCHRAVPIASLLYIPAKFLQGVQTGVDSPVVSWNELSKANMARRGGSRCQITPHGINMSQNIVTALLPHLECCIVASSLLSVLRVGGQSSTAFYVSEQGAAPDNHC